ncbi:MAG TPA: BamA/TamA family outer membrane protein [Candidatus Eisenbacteria bacterium]
MRARAFSRGVARSAAVALVAAASAWAPGAALAAPRLDYRGTVLSQAQAEGLMQRALRSRPGRGAGPDSAAVRAALGSVVGRLQDLGYLDARATAAWDSSAGGRLALRVTEGRRSRLRAIRVVTAPPADSARFAAALGLRSGDWASPQAVGDAVERTLHQVVDRGHPYAELGVGGWTQDGDFVDLTLEGSLGPLVTVSGARIEGLHVTRATVAEKAMGRVVNLPYNAAAAEAGRERLAQLGLFRSVSFAGLEGETDPGRARLVYRVEEPRYNQFEGTVGVQGQGSTVGLARLELGNLLGTGRAMGLNWQARGPGLTTLGAHYAEPQLFGTPLRLEGVLDHQVQDTLWVQTRWGAHVQMPLATAQRLEAGYEEVRVVQSGTDVEEADLKNSLFALERSTLDQPLATRRGIRARISASQTYKTEQLRPDGTRRSQASAAEVATEWHHPLGPQRGLTIELRAAGRFSSQPVLPLYERYPLGGATTLRGYDEEQFRVDRYALSRLEWRRFLGAGGQRAFLFWDHAWMATRLADFDGGSHVESLQRDGVGFGLRLQAAGGLLGLDYGLEPGRPPLEGKIHLQLVTTF